MFGNPSGGFGSGTGSGGFGNPAFGAPTGGGVQGVPGGGGLFGGAGFGTANPGFGGGAVPGSVVGGGGFGAPATGGGVFGAPAPAFGAPTPAFGAPTGGGGFGSAFGAPPSTGGFGTPAIGGAFGSQQQARGPGASPGFAGGFGTGGGFGGTGGGSYLGASNPSFSTASTSFGSQPFGSSTNRPQFGSPAVSSTGFPSTGGFGTPGSAPAVVGFGGGMQQQSAQEAHNVANENEIKREDRPTDTITSVRFTPSPDPMNQYFCVSSWDGSIRMFHLVPQGPPLAKLMTTCPAPVFDTCFRGDGQAILGACADGTVQLWNLASGMTQTQVIGRHDAPVKTVHWIAEMNLAVSSGWDKTIRYWDLRQPNPAQIVHVKDRVHAMAVKSNWMVVACGGQALPITVFDIMRSPQNALREKIASSATSLNNHPKLSIRAVAISTDNQFYCCGGIEGRVHIHYLDESKAKNNFTFRCHKTEETKGTTVIKYHNPINDIQFHSKSNVTATCGSDGAYCYWDIAERTRLHHGPTTGGSSGVLGGGGQPTVKKCMFPGGERPAPILCSAFNAEGSVYAYGIGYDWNAGPRGNNPQAQVNAVVLHYVQPGELRSKGKKN